MAVALLTACDVTPPPPLTGLDATDATTHDAVTTSRDTTTAATDVAPEVSETPGATDPLWDPEHPPTFRLTIATPGWEDALWALVPSDWCARRNYLEADLVFDNPQTGAQETVRHVGVRWRGRSSLVITDPTIQRPGLKLSFDELEPGRRFHGEKKIDLMGTEGDYSLMHEITAFQIARDAGLVTPSATYARLYVNDTFLGIYPMIEEADDDPFLERHFAGDDHGELLSVDGYCGGRGHFDDPADAPELADRYEPKAHTDVTAVDTVILPVIDCLRIADDEAFKACIEPRVDVSEVLTEVAVDVAIANPDGLHGTSQNYNVYRPTTTGRIVILPWDMDLAFAEDLLAWPDRPTTLTPTWFTEDVPNALTTRLLAVYSDAFCAALDRVLALTDPTVLLPELKARRVFLRPFIDDDPWVDVGLWIQKYLAIEHAVTNRYAVLRPAVDACLATGTPL